MSAPSHDFSRAYADVLKTYLDGAGERALEQAYELGRKALASGVGLLEITRACSEAATDLGTARSGPLGAPQVRGAWEVFAEGLSPFEMALRGYREANLELKRLTETLEEQVAARTAELADAQARYRSLVEQVPAVTYTATAEAPPRMLYVSPQIERLVGCPSDAWLERPERWVEWMHPEDRERVLAAWRSSRDASEPLRLEYRLSNEAGKTVWVRDESALLVGGTGASVRRQGILLDLTDRIGLEQQLREAQKMDAVGRMAGGVAHDFNNMLTAILSFGRFVQDDLGPEHPSRSDLEEILRAAERAAGLTRQLLLFSRRQVFNPTDVDLGEVVTSLDKMLRRLIGEDIELTTRVASGLPPIRADRGHLEQVIMNLVINARDALPTGGKIAVEVDLVAETGGARVRLAVTDTGIGMDPETQARIFEPFFTTKPQGKGTGLGLSTVYGIVQQSKGEIRVRSAPGEGTTFEILFPAVSLSAEDDAQPEEAYEARAGDETVLLVEDDSAIRAVVRRTLERAGYRVLEAGRPSEALELAAARTEPVRLLIVDIVMPGMNGQQLAQRLSERHAALKILFMSGYIGDGRVHQEILASGAAYLQKPFTPEVLLRQVRAVLDAPATEKEAS